MERQYGNLQLKIRRIANKNHSLRENDKVKEGDALAHLSHQLLVLSERIQQLERKGFKFKDSAIKFNIRIYLKRQL